eukprot:SAG31_NODE_568_length_14006_cov_4.252119_7_plen_67_part_00
MHWFISIDLSKPGCADILPLLILGLTNKFKIIARHSIQALSRLTMPDSSAFCSLRATSVLRFMCCL